MSDNMVIHPTEEPFLCTGCGIRWEGMTAHKCSNPENAHFVWPEETRIIDPETGGMKGQKDIQLHCLPWESLQELGKVYAFGSNKYEDYNFRKGYKWSLSFDALQRHLFAFWSGEDRDGESGLYHLAHAAWHCFTLLLFSITGRGTDDRPV